MRCITVQFNESNDNALSFAGQGTSRKIYYALELLIFKTQREDAMISANAESFEDSRFREADCVPKLRTKLVSEISVQS